MKPSYVEPGYQPTPDFVEPETKFSETTQWRDIPFLLLFVVHFVGIGVILGLGLARDDVPAQDRVFEFTPEMAWILAVLAGSGIVFSAIYLQHFPKAMIYTGMGFTVALFLGLGVFCCINYLYFQGAFLIIFGLFFGLYVFLVRHRIPFAVETIITCVSLVQAYPGTQITSYIALVVQVLWSALWTYTVYQASTMEQTYAIIMFVFLLFSFYWVTEVIKNVLHVTVSGIVATWYFLAGSSSMPESPTFGAAKRAMTTSFGSICFGSLIVAIIKTLRALFRSLGNSILSCIALCILGCLDALARYFNHYAFCQIAIYGKTFCQAATDTWDLFQRSGIAALANDNIIGSVLVMGSFFGAFVVGGIGALIAKLIGGDVAVITAMFIVGLVIGFVTVNLTMQVVDSSVATLFVCFAEAPEALRNQNPALYARFMQADDTTTLVN